MKAYALAAIVIVAVVRGLARVVGSRLGDPFDEGRGGPGGWWIIPERKGPRTSAVDPDTGETTGIFHPRLHSWSEHFSIDRTSCEITGRTSIGRASVVLLRLNRPLAVAIRGEEMLRERWP